MFLLPASSEEAVLSLINQENDLPIDLQPGDLYFGNVKKLDNGSILLPTVTMYDNEDYEGYANFEYKRVDLTAAFGGIRPQIHELGQTSLHRLLPIINKKLNLNLQPRDIVDQEIDWLGGNEQANLLFRAHVQSLGYEGQFIVQFTRVRPVLSEAIGNKALLTYRHPENPPVGKTSTAMRTWGMDFTDFQSALAVFNGYWTTPLKVKETMALFGIDAWPDAPRYSVQSYATKDVPEANKAFTNVIVQKNVNGPDYQGTAYFHFNRS